MPSTHLSLHDHLIFSTKERRAFISPDWRDRLHAFLGGTVRNLSGVAEIVGGAEDRVHLLVGLRATHSLADVLRNIKSASSKWVHEEIQLPLFSWQEGCGAFTVSVSQVQAVRGYIANQEAHRHKRTFQGECLEFLEKSGIEYDENHLW
jgi:REP element-mobilizing transposase RayT